jgi:hypothetical protein
LQESIMLPSWKHQQRQDSMLNLPSWLLPGNEYITLLVRPNIVSFSLIQRND